MASSVAVVALRSGHGKGTGPSSSPRSRRLPIGRLILSGEVGTLYRLLYRYAGQHCGRTVETDRRSAAVRSRVWLADGFSRVEFWFYHFAPAVRRVDACHWVRMAQTRFWAAPAHAAARRRCSRCRISGARDRCRHQTNGSCGRGLG